MYEYIQVTDWHSEQTMLQVSLLNGVYFKAFCLPEYDTMQSGKKNQRFGGTYCYHIRVRKVSRASNHKKQSSNRSKEGYGFFEGS
jgi:hypothetical protein